ncbi:MAG: hypothetical protein ACOC2L_05530 [Candidatus Sumerlaeota bacterium]
MDDPRRAMSVQIRSRRVVPTNVVLCLHDVGSIDTQRRLAQGCEKPMPQTDTPEIVNKADVAKRHGRI